MSARVTRQQAQQQQIDVGADIGPEENEENEESDDEYQDQDYVNNYVSTQSRSERISAAPSLTYRKKGWVQENKSLSIMKFTRQTCTIGSYRTEKWVRKVAIKDEPLPDTKPVHTDNNTLFRDHNSRRKSKSGRTQSWASTSQPTQANSKEDEEEEPEAIQDIEDEELEEQPIDDAKSTTSNDTNAMEDDQTSNTDDNPAPDVSGLEDILEEDE